MKINLVTVVGHATPTTKHFIDYYKDKVDEIFVNVHLTKSKKENNLLLDSIKNITNDVGCGIHKVHNGELYYRDQITDIYNETKSLKPDEWWIVADDDELQVYTNPINEIVEECEEEGYEFVTGGFLDRLGVNGTLPEINDDSDLFSQFPLGGSFRYLLSEACPNKCTLMKGKIEISSGQHYALIDGWEVRTRENSTKALGNKHPLRYPTDKCFTQVHHFKWDNTVIDRMKEIVENGNHKNWYWEYEEMLTHFSMNDWKVDITKPEFYIQNCSNIYEDFKDWDKIRDLYLMV